MNTPAKGFGTRFAIRLLPLGLAAFLRGALPVALGGAMLAAAPAPAMAQDAKARVAEAVTALRAITTLKADFVQSDSNGGTVHGTVYLKRPGKIRFQYQPGYPMTILSDGQSLYMIDQEVKDTQHWPVKNSPLGVLLNPDKDVGRFGRLVPTPDAGITAIEVRDRIHPEFGTITLVFRRKGGAPGGMELDSWVTRDAQNRQTRVTLSGQRYGADVSDELFRYVDPKARPHK